MGLMKIISLLIGVAIIGGTFYCYKNCNKHDEIPAKYFEDNHWNLEIIKGSKIPEDSLKVEKFTIDIDEKILADLNQRLNLTKFTKPLHESNFEYGFNGDHLKTVVNYWLNQYKWKNAEKQLNQLEHFRTQIEGLSVHYVHVKPKPAKDLKIFPLLVVHGWPGSFYEFYKMAPFLSTANNGIAFELIIPSIPGYGFSQAPQKAGFSVLDTARIFTKLMSRLGHERFFYHGGDWGSMIGRFLSTMYPKRVIGYHTTMASVPIYTPCNLIKSAIGYVLPSLVFENPERGYKAFFPMLKKLTNLLRESGYLHLQATKPDTISAAVINSPAGLAAYILEKYSSWTNMENINKPDGGLTEKYKLDELLTAIMIYWVTDSFPSSVRYYKESFPVISSLSLVEIPSSVKVGIAAYPNELELVNLPRSFLKQTYPNLIHYNYMEKGGHFAAFEEPKIAANDIREFCEKCLKLEEIKDKKTDEPEKKNEL